MKESVEKTLEDAIGCWTFNRDYNSLDYLATLVSSSARSCREKTLSGDPRELITELHFLRGRLGAMTEAADDALRGCKEIIDTGEVRYEAS